MRRHGALSMLHRARRMASSADSVTCRIDAGRSSADLGASHEPRFPESEDVRILSEPVLPGGVGQHASGHALVSAPDRPRAAFEAPAHEEAGAHRVYVPAGRAERYGGMLIAEPARNLVEAVLR